MFGPRRKAANHSTEPGLSTLASHPYAPQSTLFQHGPFRFTINDAASGVMVMGATGSGKSTGPGALLAKQYLAAGFGGLILCAKADECDQWREWAVETLRFDDVATISAKGGNCFNFLEWEGARRSRGGGLSINVVALLDELASAVNHDRSKGGGENQFFEDALHQLNMNLVELANFADLKLSFSLFDALLSSAPRTIEEAGSDRWQSESLCAQALREADLRTTIRETGDAKRDQQQAMLREDFEQCRKYWTLDFPGLSLRTRSVITLSFGMLVQPFVTRPLRQLFSSATNVKPEDTFDGKLIIVDLPIQEYRLAGRVANLAWKYCFQVAVMRRADPNRKGGDFHRPVFLWADEAQNFVTRFDAEYQAVARSAGGCTVYLTQNRESLRRVLGSDDAVDSLLGNLQSKWFCQNSGPTNEWASRLLGQRWTEIESYGMSAEHASTSVAEQNRLYFEPSRFTMLKRGGFQNNGQVEVVIYHGGTRFLGPDGSPHPYIMLTLTQPEKKA